MARSRKSTSSGKSAKRKRDRRSRDQAKSDVCLASVLELPKGDNASAPMADRYYELAENMNSRGAIELAVPFYRQALALLLEERKQLRQLVPEAQLLSLIHI